MIDRAGKKLADLRKAQLAAIHICRAQLGLDDDTYRAVVERVSGAMGVAHRSAADLDDAQRRALLDALRRQGAAPPRSKSKSYPGKPHNFAGQPLMITKIEAQLTDMGLSWAYADAICKRQNRIDRVAWCRTNAQLLGIIAALDVEQGKRRDGARIDAMLAEIGLSEAQLRGSITLPNNWRRQRRCLLAVSDWLCAARASRAATEGNA